jgi:hypothetical protein
MQGMDIALLSGEYFVDSAGAALPKDKVLHQYTEGGRNVTTVVTPRVKTAAQVQLGCNTLQGAELEDDGGDGSAGSHWEQRLFEGERIHVAITNNTPTKKPLKALGTIHH